MLMRLFVTPQILKYVDLLKALEQNANGQLNLFESDLMEIGSFDEPMKGCELVIHTASPFFKIGIRIPQKN